jgi:dimethylglycine dehydrogenase
MSVIPRSRLTRWLITAGIAQWHDREWLVSACTDGITVMTARKYDCLLLTGPRRATSLRP